MAAKNRNIMKLLTTLMLTMAISATGLSQDVSAEEQIMRACLNYLEGFYEGDTAKLQQSLQPKLYKFGFMKKRDGSGYQQVAPMTYDAALAYAENVREKQNFPGADAPKKVQILDIGNSIAAAKVTAWWGIDYLLLSKRDTGWMIEQVLWEGPLAATKK
ncbi:MAG TPA: hypothetical protein DEA82_16485 [Flavobacteriaceae bacterium]|nr:hypothetical protein [Flavobacteriaceae bacterium]HBR55691.1 hypothetical protein [Flavobacteriaceae bacterium]|tara:strand:+ start:786392 stop:786868 length:477 start_codon:yes stop_codon:yes gene_type:complete